SAVDPLYVGFFSKLLVWREAPQGSIPWGAQSATMHGPGTNPWSVSLVDDSSLHLEVDVRRVLLATGLLAGLSVGASVLAQAPQQQQDEIDAHIAAARAAAGLDFRNTFLNLCMPAGGRGGRGL